MNTAIGIVIVLVTQANAPNGDGHLEARVSAPAGVTVTHDTGDLETISLDCATTSDSVDPASGTDLVDGWSGTIGGGEDCEAELEFDVAPSFTVTDSSGTGTVTWPTATLTIALETENVPPSYGVLVQRGFQIGQPD